MTTADADMLHIDSPAKARPRIAMVSSALPPLLDGIGDYSSRLAGEFSAWADVTLHTARGYEPQPLAGVEIVQSFGIKPRGDIRDLESALSNHPPDHLILQYNPFCFGDKGFNPYLVDVFRRVTQKHVFIKLTVMIHERFMPGNSLKNLVMFAYQYQQFRAITAMADRVLFSTGPWYQDYLKHYPLRRSGHMPVGSNLTFVPVDRQSIRQKLNLPEHAIVLGTFGGNHPSRLFGSLAAAGQQLKSAGIDVRVLCIGSAGSAVKDALGDLPLIDLGKLPADEVSQNLQAIDIYCSPFFDGVSTRRGSFFAGLQHGLATVTTRGYNTDGNLLSHAGDAFMVTGPGDESEFVQAVVELARDPVKRQQIGLSAKRCFEKNYSLPVLADRWRALLSCSKVHTA